MSNEISMSIVSLLKNSTSDHFEITCNEGIHDFKYDIVKRTIESSMTHVITKEENAGGHIRLWVRDVHKLGEAERAHAFADKIAANAKLHGSFSGKIHSPETIRLLENNPDVVVKKLDAADGYSITMS